MDKNLIELSKCRLVQAEECIEAAKLLLEHEDFKGSVNRSYYAIFHGMRSMLLLDEVDFSKHSGVIAYFRKEYIKTGIFDIELSDIIGTAFDARIGSDYNDYFEVSEEDVNQQIINAKVFIEKIKGYLSERFSV